MNTIQRDIDVIRSKVRKMAELAESSLNDGLRALFDRDGQLAYSVILRDQQIDEYEKEIDRLEIIDGVATAHELVVPGDAPSGDNYRL